MCRDEDMVLLPLNFHVVKVLMSYFVLIILSDKVQDILPSGYVAFDRVDTCDFVDISLNYFS